MHQEAKPFSYSNISITNSKNAWIFRPMFIRIYVCHKCGFIFKSKFQNLDLCMGCRDHVHEEFESKLKTNIILTNNYK